MIIQLDLHHFKCFSLLKLPLAPLTLLSGTNASGKSSVLQVLALLHQTMREHEWSTRLMLNGDAVRLGTAADVVDQLEGRRAFRVVIQDDEEKHAWKFAGEREEMSMRVASATLGPAGHAFPGPDARGGDVNDENPEQLRWLLPASCSYHSLVHRLRDLTYLTAERLGPRDHYPLEDPQLAPVVGRAGEHTVSVLQSGADVHVIPRLAVDGVPRTRLRQVEARMAGFFPGCELMMETVFQASVVRLGVRTSRDTGFHRPGHTGFGLTQVLPIVVASLSVGVGGLLLIENPEVHLHPAGQAKMGEFLAEVASAGVQVLIETHSDHVLNGVRRAVKDGRLPADDVAVHFFRARHDGAEVGPSQVESPVLDRYGNIDVWPDGFFDQFDRDMNYFAGWS